MRTYPSIKFILIYFKKKPTRNNTHIQIETLSRIICIYNIFKIVYSHLKLILKNIYFNNQLNNRLFK